jgi:hypothetical protein
MEVKNTYVALHLPEVQHELLIHSIISGGTRVIFSATISILDLTARALNLCKFVFAINGWRCCPPRVVRAPCALPPGGHGAERAVSAPFSSSQGIVYITDAGYRSVLRRRAS